MKNIVIIGAGGFGREVAWLIERINRTKETYHILGFIDDGVEENKKVGNYRVLGNIDLLKQYDKSLNICIAIGSAKVRKMIVDRVQSINDFVFPNLIDPTAIVDKAKLGKGNIICANNIFTVDYSVKDFCIVNLSCTVGHDVEMNSYVTVYPGVNISGNTALEDCVELGTNSSVIQGKHIQENAIVGSNATVIRDIESNTVNVGVPTRQTGK